jgi:tripartite-type tricarboxylate transporter receptor subunit TctC
VPYRGGSEVVTDIGVEAVPMTPGEMDDFVKRETAANMEVIKAAGIKQ